MSVKGREWGDKRGNRRCVKKEGRNETGEKMEGECKRKGEERQERKWRMCEKRRKERRDRKENGGCKK